MTSAQFMGWHVRSGQIPNLTITTCYMHILVLSREVTANYTKINKTPSFPLMQEAHIGRHIVYEQRRLQKHPTHQNLRPTCLQDVLPTQRTILTILKKHDTDISRIILSVESQHKVGNSTPDFRRCNG